MSSSALSAVPVEFTHEEITRERLRRWLSEDWSRWLRFVFPGHVDRGFAPHHAEYWRWLWDIERDSDPAPFVGVWARGGGKSSSAELACAALGLRGKRRYALYVRDTQDRADDSVQNVAALFESEAVADLYPEHADRAVGKFGDSKGWRRNRIRTAGGFTVDALGLDVAARGVKLENQRPDVIIFDDVDGRHDSEHVTAKKTSTITDSLLPAGTDNVAVLGIQNLITPDGVFSKLADGRADFLSRRLVSGPHPAVEGLVVEEIRDDKGILGHRILGGVPTWKGQGLAACQRLLDRMGLDAFMRECQHDVRHGAGAIFGPGDFQRYDASDMAHVNASVGTYICWDTAFREGEHNDYSAWSVWRMSSDYRLKLQEVGAEKLEFPRLLSKIEEVAGRHNADRKLRAVVVEDVGSGTSALQTLRGTGGWISPYLQPFHPRGKKTERARQAAVWVRQGCALLPQPNDAAPWLHDFETQLFAFPNVEHDDMVDAFTSGILYLSRYLEEGLRFRRSVAEAV